MARLVLLGGAVVVGFYLFHASPREVTLVYDFGRVPAHGLEVEIARDGRTVRRADFRFPSGAPGQVVHRVRLPDGDYSVLLAWDGGGAARSLERQVTVRESGTVVLPVGR